jgi:hypothetical protein
MRDGNRPTEEHLLETLDVWLARLEGGDSSIGDFRTWFTSLEWEACMADGSAGLRLGWRIDTLLYTWQDYGDQIDKDWILQGVRDLLDEEPSLRPFFSLW